MNLKIKRENKGITLISLVITIIVLLILATVTIIALSGDNGILTRAKEAKEKTQQAQKDEEKMISSMENILGVYNFKNINTVDTNPAETVPENSVVLDDDANNGIVIKDKNNNEWVWVEVPKTTVFGDLTIDTTQELTEQNYNDIRDKMIEYVGVYRNGAAFQNRSNWMDEWYANDGETLVSESTSNLSDAQKSLNNGCGLTYDEYKMTYQKMLRSVYLYGGFWIGRYEAGIEGSIEEISRARTVHTDIEIGKSPKVISQQDAIPYNFVYCSEAEILAREISPDNNYTSSLLFGIQWDLVCKFLEVKNMLEMADINSDSSGWGVYKNVERIITSKNVKQAKDLGDIWESITGTKATIKTVLTTGASEETKKMNIYDFAGNENEYTLEHATSNKIYPYAARGGSGEDNGTSEPNSYRSNLSLGGYITTSFRCALY